MAKLVAVIEARMSSTRLPGKVLRQVLGRPLLSYQIERARRCRAIDEIVIATTVNPPDDPVEELARREGVGCFRGSEHDVLDRSFRAASLHGATDVMRLTGDCPLIDPEVCDRIAQEYRASGVDYARTGQSFMEGLDCEVFSLDAMRRARKLAQSPPEREYSTYYMVTHPERFRLLTVENSIDDSRFRITVDEPEDFAVVEALITSLHSLGDLTAGSSTLRGLLAEQADIQALNAHIDRNEGLKRSLRKELDNG